MAKQYNIGYYFAEGGRSVLTHGLMSFAAISMIVACLLIMGSFSLVAINMDSMLGALEQENEFIAYIDESYTQEESEALRSTLESTYNVASVEFVTRVEAMEDFLSGREENELLESLPPEVLRDRYQIRVTDIEQMEKTVTEVELVTGIAKVTAALEIAQGFVMVRNIATTIAAALVGMLLTISLFIITNTVRLATFYRREEIAIMKMCGATDGFIRWPFMVEGMILGLVGALVAFFLQWGLYQLVASLMLDADGFSLVTIVPFSDMIQLILLTFCSTGLVIGIMGSLLAIRKFLQV